MALRSRSTRMRVNPELRLPLWEKRTEWPLAIVALAFLAAYSIEVLAQPPRARQGPAGVLHLVCLRHLRHRLRGTTAARH
jgi:hypothetical protein